MFMLIVYILASVVYGEDIEKVLNEESALLFRLVLGVEIGCETLLVLMLAQGVFEVN